MTVPAVESYHGVVGWPHKALGECSFIAAVESRRRENDA